MSYMQNIELDGKIVKVVCESYDDESGGLLIWVTWEGEGKGMLWFSYRDS